MAEEVDWVVSEGSRSEPRRRPEEMERERRPSERVCRLLLVSGRRWASAEAKGLAARS